MGFDINGTQFLLAARAAGVNFERTAMIGRQKMHLLPAVLQAMLAHYGLHDLALQAQSLLEQDNRYAEPFLRAIGAGVVDSFDASDYESASCIHDMNTPIADVYRERYSVVIDGGTLEHVFNFPVAIRNCMEMIETGGFYLGITPANNFMGHGFYQFSPELYFRVFSPSNGFVTERIFLFEDEPNTQWRQLTDPEVLGRRVEMTTARPAYLLVQARKTANVAIFASPPQQSDYSSSWQSAEPRDQ